MSRILVGLVALVFVVIGLWAVADVRGMVGTVGVMPAGPGSEAELRAMYGGLEIGLGTFLFWCASDHVKVRYGLMCVVATLAGLGLVRIASIAMDMPQPTLQIVFAALELGGAALAMLELVRSGR